MSRNKTYIVITGQIASGKSALSDMLRKRSEDYIVIDADDQILDLYRRGAILYKVLVNEFGNSILNEKQNISKAKLREVVLLNDENRKKLNSLTHPVILKNMVNIAKNSDAKVVFFQIPLLNESIKYLEKLVEISEVWNITANYDVRLKRILQRKGMTEDIAKRIMAVQSEFENEDYDVLTVENNGSLEEFEEKIDLFIENGILAKTQKRGFFGRRKKAEKNIENDERKEEVVEEIEQKIEDKPLDEVKENSQIDYKEMFEEVKEEHSDEEVTKKEEFDFFENDNEKTKVIDMKNVDFSDDLESNKKDADEFKSMISSLDSVNEQDKVIKEDAFASLFKEDAEDVNEIKSDIKTLGKENFTKEDLSDLEFENDEENVKRKGKKKKKMKLWKKIILWMVAFLFICLTLFFGSIAYGGRNYSLNYLEEIQKYSSEYKVDPKIVLAIMKVESDFNPNAQSHANAKGLMQIVPETSKHVAKLLQVDENSVDLNDPETSIKFGTYYLRYLMNNYNDLNTVYAAYNGGLGNVNNWLKDEKYSSNGTTLNDIPVEETKNYVVKVNKALKAYEILYGKNFPTKKKKGFSKFLENTKNTLAYIFRSF